MLNWKLKYKLVMRQCCLMFGHALDRISEYFFILKNRRIKPVCSIPTISLAIIDQSISLGCAFLEKHQGPNGSFRGFLLFPGASNTWITSHVAFLSNGIPQLRNVHDKAIDYLILTGTEDLGWGYNRRVGMDLDSTAQALFALYRKHYFTCVELIDYIITWQSKCGGFPTFKPSGPDMTAVSAWESPHPEVTAMMIYVLRRFGKKYQSNINKATNWLENQISSGLLPSYWFDGHEYGLWVLSLNDLLSQLAYRTALNLIISTEHIPALPMLVKVIMTKSNANHLVCRSVRTIVSKQLSDGSWECEPCLRVTNPHHYEPGCGKPGRVYADRRRVFSTVHSIYALHHSRDYLFS